MATRPALARVLDAIVPPSADGRLPGAGAPEIAAAVETALAAAPELAAPLERGLAALDAVARERGAEGFAALPPEERRAALEAAEARAPGWLGGLVFQTFVAYYQSPPVLAAIGQPPRPPHPDGYDVPASDFRRLLERVRRRGRLYRAV